MAKAKVETMSITSLKDYWNKTYKQKLKFKRNHLDACPTCTAIWELKAILQKKSTRENQLLLERLKAAREKHLIEAEDRYQRFAIDRNKVMVQQTGNLLVQQECNVSIFLIILDEDCAEFHTENFSWQPPEQQEDEKEEGEREEYEVEDVVDFQPSTEGTQYLIKWKDYDESQNTWQAKSDMENSGMS